MAVLIGRGLDHTKRGKVQQNPHSLVSQYDSFSSAFYSVLKVLVPETKIFGLFAIGFLEYRILKRCHKMK